MRRRGEWVDRASLVDELVALVPVAGWGHRLGSRHAGPAYARLVEVAAVLGFPPPPALERLADGGEDPPVGVWFARCGIG